METIGSRRQYYLIVTVTTTPRMPVATAHVYTLATVREIPPVPRPGTFDSTW